MIYPTVRFGAVRCGFRKPKSCGTLRRGSPLNGFFCQVQFHSPPEYPNKTVFSLRCTACLNRSKPRFRTVLAIFVGALTKALFLYCLSTVHRVNNPYKPAGSHGFLTYFFIICHAKSTATAVTRIKTKDFINRYELYIVRLRGGATSGIPSRSPY